MNCLVTGGSGFIGAYTIKELLSRNQTVVSLDASNDQNILKDVIGLDEVGKITKVSGDILDLPLLLDTIKTQRIDRIVHLASLQIPASNANPPLAVRINCEGMLNVLEACRLCDIKRLVWASSIAVFGSTELYGNEPVLNDAAHHPMSVYGACKSLNEYLAKHYFEKYGVDSIGFRFTAVYGVGRLRGMSSFTTKMIEMVARRVPYTVPFGDDLVDWQYVEDVSNLIVVACAHEGTTGTRVFNTQGDVRPVIDGVNFLRKISNAELKVESGKWGIAWRYDTQPLRDQLGFTSKYRMEDGIRRTYESFLSGKANSHVPFDS
jgi:nucleoside-diphosphate-sugar epimerase